MSTLTYGNHDFAPAAPEAKADKAPPKSFWKRWLDRLIESRQRQAEREIARFLANHGGLLTDDMEREMMRRMSQNGRKAV